MKEKEPKLTQDFLVKHALEHFENSKNWRDEKIRPQWIRSNNLYDGIFDIGDRDKSEVLKSQGKLFIPKTYSHLQRILVDIMEAFFFDPEEIVNITAWKSIPYETREIVKALLNYRLNGHPINFKQESFEACQDALKNKIGVFKVYPELDLKEPVDGEKWRPVIEAVPYEDIFFHPDATWKDYWKFPMVHRMRKSMDYLKKRGYKNLDMIGKNFTEPTANDDIKEQRALDQGSPFSKRNDSTPLGTDVFIYEIWTFLDIDNDGHLESVYYTTAGDAGGPQVIIKDIQENKLPYGNGRNCFVAGSAFPEAHKMYGKDLPQLVEDLQKEANAIRNQNREAVAIGIRKPLLVNRSAGVDVMGLLNRRIGGVVLGDDISTSSIRELDVGGSTAGSAQQEARNDADFFETTSQSPTQLGASTKGEETATEVSTIAANANKKISMIIGNLAATLFVPTFKMLLQLEQEYETDAFIKKVTGRVLGRIFVDEEGAPTPKKVIKGEFELTANTGINKQQQLNKFLLLMDRANMVNQTTAQMVQMGVVSPDEAAFFDTMTMFKRILPVVGEKNVEEYVLKAQQPPQPEGGGIPSQRAPSQGVEALMAEVTNMNPEGMI